jgi:glycerol-3-phosphate dehydrogenase
MNDALPIENGYRTTCLAEITRPGMEWDLVVIGGGATGLGIALDSVMRGYKTLLLERSDFAKGTSSRSTKLVHGGVRYLAQGELKLVREASVERGRLYHNAPHLVKNQTFIIPIYSLWERIKYSLGLKFYDLIAGKRRLGWSTFISRKETLEQMPGIKPEKLTGGVMYHDGQFDDARLAINLAQTIWDKGGFAINYVSVNGLLKDGQKVSGVIATDLESGEKYSIHAKAVVNATGVFADDILQMDNPGSRKTLRVSQGVHLVLDKKFYPSEDALMIPETSDGRVLFAVPWHDKVVVGTTDTLVEEASPEPQALEKEIAFILETAAAYFTMKPTRNDVLSVFAGLRPLAAPQKEEQKTKEISRGHKIIVSPAKLFTIVGGKWTTYRRMGEDMVNRIERELHWKPQHTGTENLSIHGSAQGMNWSDPFYFYGNDAGSLRVMMNGNANQWISESLHIHEVQVIWAVKNEMARTLEDVLSRRTRALLLDAKESVRIALPVARIMAKALGKDEAWVQQQVNEYCHLAAQYTLH